VRNLAAMLNGDLEALGTRHSALGTPLVACIGPITAKTAEELGLRVDVVASEYTVEGLVRAIKVGAK
jgi:uroporphyrinogen-III synthase